jgi:hypothetical protein
MLLPMTISKQNIFALGLVGVSSNVAIPNMFVKSSAIEVHVAAAERPSLMKFPAIAAEQFFSHPLLAARCRRLANLNVIDLRYVGILRSNTNATWMTLVLNVHTW